MEGRRKIGQGVLFNYGWNHPPKDLSIFGAFSLKKHVLFLPSPTLLVANGQIIPSRICVIAKKREASREERTFGENLLGREVQTENRHIWASPSSLCRLFSAQRPVEACLPSRPQQLCLQKRVPCPFTAPADPECFHSTLYQIFAAVLPLSNQ